MSGKKPLVKQKSAFGSLGGGKLRESEEDLSLKEPMKGRVSFEGESVTSDDGSDVENSFGRNNRSHGNEDVLNGLFRDSSFGERQNSGKGRDINVITKENKRTIQEYKGQPLPVPRHHSPVSPRQSPTERHVIELGTLQQPVKVDYADESTVTWSSKVRDRQPVPVPRTAAQKQLGESATLERTSPRPSPRSRPKLSAHEGSEKLLVSDSEAKHEWTRDTKQEKPNAPLRKKQLMKQFDYESQNSKRPQVPRIKTTLNDDDDDDGDDNDENNDNAQFLYGDKRRINVGLAATVNDYSDHGDVAGIVTDPESASRTSLIRRQWSKEEQLSHSRPETAEKPAPDSSLNSGLIENGILDHIDKHARSVSATSLETLSTQQSFLERKKLIEHGANRVLPKKGRTPQRPQSAKKSSPVTKLSRKDITDTFEEHVALSENIIDYTGGKEQFKRKVNHTLEAGRVEGIPRHHFSQPIKASQGISGMTKSPQLEETVRNSKGRHLLYGKSPMPKRASSLTNLRGHSPEPWNQVLDQNSLDTSSIRQAVYDEWLARKSSRMKEQLASKASDKKKEEQKEEDERQRKLLANKAFDSWKEKKQEENKETSVKKKKLMKKELEMQKEKNLKARDANKYFESWKAKKDEQLKEQHQKKRKENQEKNKKEEDQKQENTVNAKKAFENWKNKKDEIINEEIKKKRREERENAMQQEDDKYERSIQCAERYQAWVEKKGKPRRGPSPPHLTQRGWCPSGRRSGNCIPDKVGSVIQIPSPNRSRSYSATQLGSSKV